MLSNLRKVGLPPPHGRGVNSHQLLSATTVYPRACGVMRCFTFFTAYPRSGGVNL